MCVVLMIKELLIVTLEFKSLIGCVSPNRLVVHPVDSDIGSDPDTRKSMIDYLLSLNDNTISWRSSRQG
jgi:hypothetical protein